MMINESIEKFKDLRVLSIPNDNNNAQARAHTRACAHTHAHASYFEERQQSYDTENDKKELNDNEK